MESIGEKFSAMLLEIGAIQLRPTEPFTWSSGWRAPIYTDNRKTLAYPAVRTFVKEQLVRLIRAHYPSATAVAGVATGAIAQGVLVAETLAMPYCYVRPQAKDHGTGQQIEGALPAGSRVVVVEDLISTGGSSLKAVAALRSAGHTVVGMVASYTYGFAAATEAFQQAQVPIVTISDYATTMAVAESKQLITPAERELLRRWREAPDIWMQENNEGI